MESTVGGKMVVKTLICVLEVRRLLYDIYDRRPDICFRYRLLGEMWAICFMRVIKVTDRGVMLRVENEGTLVPISDLSNVMQFELDHSFLGFQAHYHYEVRPCNDDFGQST